ncbi:MAG: aldo/keto reductase [Pseudomonadota bacterium]
MPKVAIAPLFVLWVGTQIESKIVMALLVSIFPMVVDSVVGLRSVDPGMLDLARTYRGSKLQMFWKIRFPNALPNIFAGMKVAISLALVGTIVGEFVGSNYGLGYVILQSQGHLQHAARVRRDPGAGGARHRAVPDRRPDRAQGDALARLAPQPGLEDHGIHDTRAHGFAGLGRRGWAAAGFSRLGLGTGKTPAEAEQIVRGALDRGVTLFDTAAAYGTETVVGRAIKDGGARSGGDLHQGAAAEWRRCRGRGGGQPGTIRCARSTPTMSTCSSCMACRRPSMSGARDVIAPVLLREKEKGKLRHLGITETRAQRSRASDARARRGDGLWDVAMVSFHMLHQNARRAVFPLTRQHSGRHPADVRGAQDLRPAGAADHDPARARDHRPGCRPSWRMAAAPLDFLIHPGGAASLTDARLPLRKARARRRCRAVRHRRSRPSRDQPGVAARAAAARARPRPDRGAVRQSGRHRPRTAPTASNKLRAQQAAG